VGEVYSKYGNDHFPILKKIGNNTEAIEDNPTP
jgi:hypothetical protein